MSESPNVAKSIRERLGGNTEDRLGRALTELLENPLLTGAISRAFDAREKATQAQEVAMGALNLPSAADIERLTRRLRAVSHRLEGIEDGVDRLDRALTPRGVDARLDAIEAQLRALTERLERSLDTRTAPATKAPAQPVAAKAPARPRTAKAPATKRAREAKAKISAAGAPKKARAKRTTG